MTTFENFLVAEAAAENAARLIINPDLSLAFVIIEDRNAGKPWTEKEVAEARFIYRDALKTLKRRTLTDYINAGLVRDCKMLRRFMAGTSTLTIN